MTSADGGSIHRVPRSFSKKNQRRTETHCMQTRRALLSGMGVAAAAVATSPLAALPRERERCTPPSGISANQDGMRFSPAVSEGVLTALAAVYANGGSDRAKIQVAAHAWKVTADHFGEVGFFSVSDQMLRDADPHAALAAAYENLPAQVAENVMKRGGDVSEEEVRSRIAALSPESISAAIAMLHEHGTRAAFDRVAQLLNQASSTRVSTGSRIASHETNECQALAMIEATLWILAGLYSLGCAVTLGLCVVCCVAAAVLSIAAGVVDLIGAYSGC